MEVLGFERFIRFRDIYERKNNNILYVENKNILYVDIHTSNSFSTLVNSSMRRSSLVSIGSVGGLTLNKRNSTDSHFSLVAPDTTLMPWILVRLLLFDEFIFGERNHVLLSRPS